MPTPAQGRPRARRASAPAPDEAQLAKQAKRAPYLLRITRRSDLPPPLLIVKERIAPEDRDDVEGLTHPRAKHLERGSSAWRGRARLSARAQAHP